MSWIKNLLGLKPTQEEFVQIAKDAIRQLSNSGEIVYDQEQYSLALRPTDGSIGNIYFLGNAYQDYCAVPRAERASVLSSYFRQGSELPQSLDEAMPNILPRVQQRSFYEEMVLRARVGEIPTTQAGEAHLPYVPIAEHFAKGLVYDTPQSVAQLSAHKYNEWNTQLDALLPDALSNLMKLTPQPFETLAPGVYVSQQSDTYDATRLLLLERVRECKVMGRPVVMLPNRNLLLLTGESDHAGQSVMVRAAEQMLNQPRPMAAIPLVLSETAWFLWQPSLDHPDRKLFDYLRAVAMADIYNSQKNLLDRIHEKEATDIFVASYMALQKQDTGEVSSCAVWTEGVHTLLPVVDKISFGRPAGADGTILCTVPWDVVRHAVGNLMKPVGGYPQRYEVDDFPSDNQIAEMKKHAE